MLKQKNKLFLAVLLGFVVVFSFFALCSSLKEENTQEVFAQPCTPVGSTGCNILSCCTTDCWESPASTFTCCESNASCTCCEADKNGDNVIDIADLSLCSLSYTGCALYGCISCTGSHLNEICSGCGEGHPQIECTLTASPTSGAPPLNVGFLATITDLNGLTFDTWQIDYGDGNTQCLNPGCSGNPNGNTYWHTYTSTGKYYGSLSFFSGGVFMGGCRANEVVALGPPQNLRHTSNATNFINWQWDASSDPDVYYRVYTKGIGILTGVVDSFFTEFWNSPVLTNAYQQTSYLEGGLGYSLQNFVFNMKNIVGVSACIGTWMGPDPDDPCSSIVEARAATSIETPNIITCEPTSNSLNIQINSNERMYNSELMGFSYFDTTNWGVGNNSRVYSKVELSGSPIANTSWLINPLGGTFVQRANPFVVPSPWLVSGLTSATAYTVCARSVNQDNQLNTSGDFRPGSGSTDWTCVSCATTGAPEPASLGYLKLYHQGLGTIKLNLIKASDALLKSPFPGMVKVARFNGDTNSAADLVPVSDPMASPVRVYTGLTGAGSPNGIWAWKKLP